MLACLSYIACRGADEGGGSVGIVLHFRYNGRSRNQSVEMETSGLFVDLGEELVVAEEGVFLVADFDGAAAEL